MKRNEKKPTQNSHMTAQFLTPLYVVSFIVALLFTTIVYRWERPYLTNWAQNFVYESKTNVFGTVFLNIRWITKPIIDIPLQLCFTNMDYGNSTSAPRFLAAVGWEDAFPFHHYGYIHLLCFWLAVLIGLVATVLGIRLLISLRRGSIKPNYFSEGRENSAVDWVSYFTKQNRTPRFSITLVSHLRTFGISRHNPCGGKLSKRERKVEKQARKEKQGIL